MPKNKVQGFIFGVIMSYAMAYGMEVYNIAVKEGVNLAAGGFSNMTVGIFWDALIEALYMGLFVLLFSNLWGGTGSARHSPQDTAIRKKIILTYASFCARQGLSPSCVRR